MRDEVAWLVLGAAVGSRQVLARLLADVPSAAFPTGRQRQLYAALGRGKADVVQMLGQLGVVVRDDEQAADALLATARCHGEREAQKSLARRLETAAKLMSPEQFREYAAQLVEEHIAHQTGNPEAVRGAAATDRQANAGRGEAQAASTGPMPRTAG